MIVNGRLLIGRIIGKAAKIDFAEMKRSANQRAGSEVVGLYYPTTSDHGPQGAFSETSAALGFYWSVPAIQ